MECLTSSNDEAWRSLNPKSGYQRHSPSGRADNYACCGGGGDENEKGYSSARVCHRETALALAFGAGFLALMIHGSPPLINGDAPAEIAV